MDKAKIIRLCDEIKDIATEIQERTMKDSYFMAQTIINKVLVIEAEVSAKPKTNADRIRRMTDEELAELIVRYSIQGAIQANGIVDIERIKSIENDTINSACGRKDLETALNMLRQEAEEDA